MAIAMTCCEGVFIFMAAVVVGTVHGATHTDIIRLHKNLTQDYNIYVRPTFNQSEPTNIKVSFFLLSIKELDEKTGKLAIVGFFLLSWTDFQLQWNLSEYDNTYTIFLSKESVWKPEIVLVNPYEEIKPLGYDGQNIRAVYNGEVYWIPVNVYESTCAIDVTYYPFDNQTCAITFSSVSYAQSELQFTAESNQSNLLYFYENGLWEVTKNEVHIDNYASPSITLMLGLKRRPIFHLLNTVIPLSIIGLLNVLVFLLPAESGERIGFSITVLLAMAVFMTIVTDSLPSNSEPSVPLLCYFLLFDLGTNVVITVCAILGLHFHHKSYIQKVPNWLCCIVCGRYCLNKTDRNNSENLSPDHSSQEEIKDTHEEGSVLKLPTIYHGKNDITDVNTNKSQAFSKKHNLEISWKDVASFLDKLFFFLFFAILIIKNIVVFMIFWEYY
ncbi:neuronal acetylcholine receptor subunit alpha-3-like [Argopecten irradians]|uniref:neuronal acetylcholine receptor subunit alpha-3-like n=1 Tax=Argopecten irradians TaxID=31199 RepID=UPI00371C0379